jgi:hypothetical protein
MSDSGGKMDYKKLWQKLWDWLEEEPDASFQGWEVQGKMTELEQEAPARDRKIGSRDIREMKKWPKT